MKTLRAPSFNISLSVLPDFALRVSSVTSPGFVRSQNLYIFAAIFGRCTPATKPATNPGR